MPADNVRHPITGCRVNSIFDMWLHTDEQLSGYVDLAWTMVEKGQLARCAEESKELQRNEKMYRMEDGIAHLEISGPMTKHSTSFQSLFGGTSTLKVREALREIRADTSVQGIMIHTDSYGGTADGTASLAEDIRKTDSVKPVHVHAEDAATSAALWTSVSGRRFTCGPSAAVGSLGTMTMLLDTSKNAEKTDAKPLLFVTGKYKGIGAPGIPITDEHKQEIQRRVDGINEPFKNDVIKHRKLNKEQSDEVLTARVFIGQQAKDIGLVDAICSTDDAVANLKEVIKALPASRTPGSVPKTGPSTRSPAMALTAEQLTSARELPGGTAITAENADVTLLGIAQQQANQSETFRTQIADLRKQIPVKMDLDIAKGKADLFCERLDLMAEKGTVLPVQVATLKKAVKNGDVVCEAFLTDAVQLPLMEVLKNNKPNGLMTEVTGGQPAPKQEQNNSEIPTFARCNDLRQKTGLKPITPDEYEQKYGIKPEAAGVQRR